MDRFESRNKMSKLGHPGRAVWGFCIENHTLHTCAKEKLNCNIARLYFAYVFEGEAYLG